MVQTLVSTQIYDGRYVALRSFEDSTVLADGATPQEAHDNAVKAGHANFIITFIPAQNMVQIF